MAQRLINNECCQYLILSWFYSCMVWKGCVLFMAETMWKSGTIKWIYRTNCQGFSMLCSILSHFWYRQYLNCFQKPMQQIYSTKIKWKSKNLTFGNIKRRYVWSFRLTKTKIIHISLADTDAMWHLWLSYFPTLSTPTLADTHTHGTMEFMYVCVCVAG